MAVPCVNEEKSSNSVNKCFHSLNLNSQLSSQYYIVQKKIIHERNVHLMHFHYRYTTLIIWRVIFHQYNVCVYRVVFIFMIDI